MHLVCNWCVSYRMSDSILQSWEKEMLPFFSFRGYLLEGGDRGMELDMKNIWVSSAQK